MLGTEAIPTRQPRALRIADRGRPIKGGGGCYQDIIYKAMTDDIFRPHLTLYAFSVTIKSHLPGRLIPSLISI
jgi:hypothetical protein